MWFDNMDTALILAGMAFFALAFLFLGLWQYMRQHRQRRNMVQKIQGGVQSMGDMVTGHAPQDQPLSRKPSPAGAFFGFLGQTFSGIQPSAYTGMRLVFLKAGIRHSKAEEMYWGAKCFLAIGTSAVFFFTRLTLFEITNSAATITVTVLTALIGYYLPDAWLRIKIYKRRVKLLNALPDALDLLVVCVEAGMGLDGAFQRVAKEIGLTSPELSDELMLLNLELRAGKSRQDALRNLAARSDLDAMTSLVTLMVQTDRFGTSMANTLRVFSDGYRTQRYQRAEERAAKIPIKLVFPLILFIFPSLFTVILGPAAIRIWQNIIAN